MDLQVLKNQIIDYLFQDFDHDLINNQRNNPFVQISIINTSLLNPHRDSFGFYVTKLGAQALHLEFTPTVMAQALTLEALYLTNKPSRGEPAENLAGYSRGIPAGKNQVIIVTVIASQGDASFVCQSVINQIQILLSHL